MPRRLQVYSAAVSIISLQSPARNAAELDVAERERSYGAESGGYRNQFELNRSRCRLDCRFGLRVDSRNHALDGVQIAPCSGSIFRGKDMPRLPGHAR